MNLMNIMLDKSGLPANSMGLGASLGLWELAGTKITNMNLYIIYSKQVQDKDLKKLLKTRINTTQKQLETIKKYFNAREFDAPEEPNWEKKLNDDSSFTIPSSILNDKEIAIALRENVRSALSVITETLRNSVVPEARNLVYDILKEDNKNYEEVIELQIKKNWTNFPPALIQQ